MTSPGIDPRLVAALVADVAALRGQLDRVDRGLHALQNTLAATPAPASTPVAPMPMPMPGSIPGSIAAPPPGSIARPLPGPPIPPPAVPPRGAGAGSPAQPWWQRDGVVSKVLAVAGGVVTLMGVAMLVGLAIQAGWFGPAARVGSGGLLSLVLLGVAERLIHRPGGRVGALAVGSTGVAGLAVTVMAMGEVGYRWLAALPAAGALVAVAAIGLLLAQRWSSQAVAAVTTAALGSVAWLSIGDAPALGALLLLGVQIAVLVVQYPRVWAVVHLFAGLLPISALLPLTGTRHIALVVTLSLVAMVIATVAATATLRRVGEPEHRGLSTAAAIAIVAPLLPLLVAIGDNSPPLGLGNLAILLTLALVAGAATLPIRRTPLPAVVRTALGVVAVVTTLRLALAAREPITTEVVLMMVALVLLAIAISTRSMLGWVTGWFFGTLGLLVALGRYGDGLVYVWLRDDLDGAAVMFGALTVLAVAAGITAGRRLRAAGNASDLMIAGHVLIGLLGVTLTSVAVGTLINPEASGWVAGHCAATVVWMAVAVASLQRGLVDRDNPRVWLIAGLSLAAMATAKLFLFDLSSLGGVPRALAFLLVGVLLLIAGTRYARTFAERRGEITDAQAHAQAGPPVQ